jgi:hypothetical protein
MLADRQFTWLPGNTLAAVARLVSRPVCVAALVAIELLMSLWSSQGGPAVLADGVRWRLISADRRAVQEGDAATRQYESEEANLRNQGKVSHPTQSPQLYTVPSW